MKQAGSGKLLDRHCTDMPANYWRGKQSSSSWTRLKIQTKPSGIFSPCLMSHFHIGQIHLKWLVCLKKISVNTHRQRTGRYLPEGKKEKKNTTCTKTSAAKICFLLSPEKKRTHSVWPQLSRPRQRPKGETRSGTRCYVVPEGGNSFIHWRNRRFNAAMTAGVTTNRVTLKHAPTTTTTTAFLSSKLRLEDAWKFNFYCCYL